MTETSPPQMDRRRRLLALYVVGVTIFLLAPLVLPMIISFSSGSRIEFPPPGFSLQWYRAALANEAFRLGLVSSLIIAALATMISVVAGTAAALAINHYRFAGRSIVQIVLMLPLALPAIVKGLGVLFVLPMYNMSQGVAATVLAHCTMCIPYVAYMVLATLANYDITLEQASLNLGASRARTFRRITLPLIKPGILAGAVFAFLMSFDNISLSLFTSRGDTLPLRLMQHIQHHEDPTVAAVSSFLVVVALLIMLLFGRVLREGQMGSLSGAR